MRPLEIEMIRDGINAISRRKAKAGRFGEVPDQSENAYLLRTKPANEWLKLEYGKPQARALFGGFWFEHELCILFADTNLGKSVLAVQIGNALTNGGVFGPLNNQMEASTNVLYIDFELGSKQFEARYFDPRWGSYQFGETFFRSQFNPDADDPVLYDNYDDFLKEAIEMAIRNVKARVLIIDNITYMRRGTEQAKDALPLMKMLKALKVKYKLSILVLAHTPKRNAYNPITVNDLQGSKMLINFADSAFAIGKSHTTPGLRYLKQIKQRNQQELYGEANVCLIRQEKELNFLGFAYVGNGHERDHLIKPESRESDLIRQQVIELSEKGNSCRQIARQLGVHFTTVGRILQRTRTELQPEQAL